MNQNYTTSIQNLPAVQGFDVTVENRAALSAKTASIKVPTPEISGPNPNI